MKNKLLLLLLLIVSQPMASQDYRLFNNIQNSPSNNVFFVQGSEIYSYATMDNPLNVNQPLIAPASVGALSGITKLWKNDSGINIGEVASFDYYDNMNPPFIPGNVYTAVNQPVQEDKYYIFKIRTNQNADAFGLLMEFGGIPYPYVDCRDNVLEEAAVNSPVTITLRTEHDVVEGQYFYIRYRHSNDPVGVYQWGQFTFNAANSRFGQFVIPGFATSGTVSYNIYCKGRSISSFTDTSYTSDIYNVANYENNYQYQVKNSLSDRVNTTFFVNMNGQTITDDGVYLDITTNNKRSYCKLSLVSGSIYSVTLATPKNSNQVFRFYNGSNGKEAFQTPPCLSPVRNYFVNQQASSTPTYCYNSCVNNCSVADNNVNVTFRVDVSNNFSTDPVFLESNISTVPLSMTAVGNGIYQVTVSLIPNTNVVYRFKQGPFQYEINRKICSVNYLNERYRFLRVPNSDQTLSLVCFNECSSCTATPIATVTLRVNMTGQNIAPTGVFVAGSFNGWSTTANPMTYIGNGIYETDVQMTANQFQEYKFLNGTTYETFSQSQCASQLLNGNRYQFVDLDESYGTPCFGQCVETCGSPSSEVDVTFRVDMTGQIISPLGVKLSGTFNGFSTTATPMTAIGNNLYEAVLSLPQNESIQYKFVNGNAYEIVPSACGILDANNNYNRVLTVPAVDTILPTVCMSQCSATCFSGPQSVTFRVNMANETISTTGVFLSGTFNNWSTTANPMVNIGNNIFETVLTLTSNTLFEYKFVNGTQFEFVPQACGADSGGSIYNRTFVVPNQSFVLATVCFGECFTCTTCPAPSQLSVSNITSNSALLTWTAPSSLPSNGYEIFYNTTGIAPNSATIALDTSTNPFDGINNLNPNTTYFYWVRSNCGTSKSQWIPSASTFTTAAFSNCNSADYGLFPTTTFTPACTGVTETIVSNAWASEYSNVNVIANKQYTFSSSVSTDFITITNQSGTQVIVSGQSPVNWYSGTFTGVIRYFIHTNSNCGNAQVNRIKRIVCNNPTTAAVLFSVNMSNQTVSQSGVKLSGSFNGWSTTANPMTAQGNGIYNVLITLPVGSVIQYKFVNGSTFEQVPVSCGVNDGNNIINRFLHVNTNGVTNLPVVCFNECLNCTTLGNDQFEQYEMGVYPNPVSSGQSVNIQLLEDDFVSLYDISGKIIAEKWVTVANPIFELTSISAGIYFLKSKSGVAKIIVQ
jgi:hypothetical protein